MTSVISGHAPGQQALCFTRFEKKNRAIALAKGDLKHPTTRSMTTCKSSCNHESVLSTNQSTTIYNGLLTRRKCFGPCQPVTLFVDFSVRYSV